jgi:hypothetical protein
MRPTKPINVTGRSDWKYKPASTTDVAETIRQARKRLARDEEERRATDLERISKVRTIRR